MGDAIERVLALSATKKKPKPRDPGHGKRPIPRDPPGGPKRPHRGVTTMAAMDEEEAHESAGEAAAEAHAGQGKKFHDDTLKKFHPAFQKGYKKVHGK